MSQSVVPGQQKQTQLSNGAQAGSEQGSSKQSVSIDEIKQFLLERHNQVQKELTDPQIPESERPVSWSQIDKVEAKPVETGQKWGGGSKLHLQANIGDFMAEVRRVYKAQCSNQNTAANSTPQSSNPNSTPATRQQPSSQPPASAKNGSNGAAKQTTAATGGGGATGEQPKSDAAAAKPSTWAGAAGRGQPASNSTKSGGDK